MKSSHATMLRAIAVFKFLKAAMLIAASLGALRLLHQDVGAVAEHWVHILRLDPGNHYVETALARASRLSPTQIKQLGLGGLFYAALFLTEGIGLWLRKRWAEWLTVIITSTLVPLELYEIWRHITAMKIVALVINLAIVGYLIYCIRREDGRR
jgi:uncharacterized membrane protein (DUF2068 family)